MPGRGSILVADDEESLRLVLEAALMKAGFDVDTVDNGADAVRKIQEKNYEVALLDIRMPKLDGLEAFYQIHGLLPDLPVILMTAFGSAEVAVEAMKRGAFDYLPKPFNLEEVKILVERAIHMRVLAQEVEYLTLEVQTLSVGVNGLCKLVGTSPKVQEVYKSIGRVAETKATVLLTGESGTGKGLVAKSIHYNSDRWEKPFVQVNCGAIPEGLLESELFGHEKGAFTGAVSQRMGKFELAEGGTLFLDEIGEMSLALQVKLLRVLQEKQFERVGGSQTFSANVRVIAATNRDLSKEIAENRFRSDLYYRLNVIPVHLPPLRERGGDIRLLAEYFLRRFSLEMGRVKIAFSPEVLELFMQYAWPGNVRELENAVEHALIMSNSAIILPENLPANLFEEEVGEIQASQDTYLAQPLREILAFTEKASIAQALERTNGNRAQAARLLQISRRALIYKIQEYQLV
ncbi:sigma-54-dependent transcriptional regulator [Desulfosporosinus metallidurans]|uniref:DNA-binding transcriptional regulator NtrC n=1 Tax=Desulfosporosinus metallidurans TaxID=1888891 RepID=A0A1Q8QX06_9FIRM|nr:sigma-54 dependent transcriptional regulator [Desulfosporosinus metallidurans]OLN31861.1 Response regulator of zinc sigma-54-dependent two-component system [Desulfosporosinus metallidurans]